MSERAESTDTETLADDLEPLRQSLRWHFACHAEEPNKSYASLGIANAENIVERLIAARVARARAEALNEAADALRVDGPPMSDVGREILRLWLRARAAAAVSGPGAES